MCMLKTFPELLKEYRKEHNLSQAALAKKLGVSQSLIGMYETNRNKPTPEDYPLFTRLFEISMVELINALYPLSEHNEYERFLVKLDSGIPVEELKKDYLIELDGLEVTDEELEKAIDTIRFNRYKKSMKPDVIPFKQKD